MAAQADYSKTFKAEGCSGRHERVESLCMYWAWESKPYALLGAGIFFRGWDANPRMNWKGCQAKASCDGWSL